jgi:Prolyl oligopeptidase family
MRKATSVAARLAISALSITTAATLFVAPASAQLPEGEATDLFLFSKQTPRGSGSTRSIDGIPTLVAKTADGDISDWVGAPSRYGGTAVYSGGEFVYQDHIFDAYGADDGRDADRLAQTDPLEEVFPEAYRLDALAQADAPGELGADEAVPEQYRYDATYGDSASGLVGRSDLHEVRLAMDDDNLALLARTTTLTAPTDTALLVLVDAGADTGAASVPFDSGLSTSVADAAFFIADGKVLAADLATGAIASVDGAAAVVQPAGWTNAVEATIPFASIPAFDEELSLAVASGTPNGTSDGFADLALETGDGSNPNIANVAFRFEEPVRMWFERQQALALQAGSIDDFFTTIDTDELIDESEEYVPGPGYHDRIFLSDPDTGVPQEGGRDGIVQHYGIFIPSAYDGETPVPLQWWLHWRGGTTHSGASIVPKVMKQFGEDRDTLVVGLGGRGTSTWYVGKGHVDFLEVWEDVFKTFAIDDRRVYVSGHSMGGWGSYLLPLVYPDRFAAAAPVAGPVTQGAWVGADCSSCYVSANESRPRDQHNRKLLDNALHVPYAILQGTNDELVWYWAVATNAVRLTELDYRHRFFTYPGYEHYSHPIADQWAEAASYMHQFEAPENPAHVVYKRDMPFERATEEVQTGGATLNFDFDSAYWMSGLTPTDLQAGVATFDGTSLAIDGMEHAVVPDTGAPTAPGQTGPYLITGLQWVDVGLDPAEGNGFEIALSGASGVQLDLDRMNISVAEGILGTVETEAPLALRLSGGWGSAPGVLLDGQPVSATFADGVLEVAVPAGTHAVTILGVGGPVGAV